MMEQQQPLSAKRPSLSYNLSAMGPARITTTHRASKHAPLAPDLLYEARLNRDSRWALAEASHFFEEKSAVHDTLRRIVSRLDELGIPYVVSGGLALFAHGFRRFTEDIDLLVSPEGLKRIHQELEGLGYVPPFKGSKHLRDVESGVRVEFLVSGGFPGDGKPKPVAFPDPASVSMEKDGIKYLSLPALIELKLASGMTNSQRLKDLSDVMELIKLLALPADFSSQLNPFVREKYSEIWRSVAQAPKRYLRLWRNKFLTVDATTLDEMIQALRAAAQTLESMRADGVVLEAQGGTADDYAYLVTSDPNVAKKYEMIEESEFWGEDQDDESGNTQV
jgi:hypothetical protein